MKNVDYFELYGAHGADIEHFRPEMLKYVIKKWWNHPDWYVFSSVWVKR